MMKKQVLLAVLAVLAAYVSCTEVEPVELQYGESYIANYDPSEGPVQVVETFEEVNPDLDFLGLVRSNSLLFRSTVNRGAVANTVLIHRVTYTGRAATRISSVRRVFNVAGSSVITAGGVGFNRVTVEVRSQRGRGLSATIEIFGRL